MLSLLLTEHCFDSISGMISRVGKRNENNVLLVDLLEIGRGGKEHISNRNIYLSDGILLNEMSTLTFENCTIYCEFFYDYDFFVELKHGSSLVLYNTTLSSLEDKAFEWKGSEQSNITLYESKVEGLIKLRDSALLQSDLSSFHIELMDDQPSTLRSYRSAFTLHLLVSGGRKVFNYHHLVEEGMGLPDLPLKLEIVQSTVLETTVSLYSQSKSLFIGWPALFVRPVIDKSPDKPVKGLRPELMTKDFHSFGTISLWLEGCSVCGYSVVAAGKAEVSVAGSDLFSALSYDESQITLVDSSVQQCEAHDQSSLLLYDSKITDKIRVCDESKAFLENSEYENISFSTRDRNFFIYADGERVP